MSKGLQRSIGRATPVKADIQKITLSVQDVTVSVVDGAPGYGSAVIGDLPEGNILFLGAVSYLQFTTTDADVTATFDGDYAIGTVATVDGDVSDSGEANIVASTALGAATAKLSPVVRGVGDGALTGVVFDNTDGSLEINLNLLIDDAAISGAADFTASGYLVLAYIVLGDD